LIQDLREQLEAHVVTIETLRAEIKTAQVQHGKVIYYFHVPPPFFCMMCFFAFVSVLYLSMSI
jgi:hypothetical protein